MFSPEHKSAPTRQWQEIVNTPPKDWEELSPPPGCPPIAVHVADVCDFTVAPRPAATMNAHGLLMASPTSHLVTEPDRTHSGFRRWWKPLDRLIGSICIQGTEVFLVSSTPWDGSAKGRLAAVLRHTPQRQKGKVGDFFKCFDPLQAVDGEVRNLPECDQLTVTKFTDKFGFPPRLFVLLKRYQDNIYMVFANIYPPLREAVLFASATLLRATYTLPLKWEPHGADMV